MLYTEEFEIPVVESTIEPLREEALRRYELCLSNGSTRYLQTFIEQQLAFTPPPTFLLNGIANDLQQRLLALREYYFDVRENVVQVFFKTYQIDITSIAPLTDFDNYHRLDAEALLSYARNCGATLTQPESTILLRMIEASLKMCSQLAHDIQMTTQLLEMLEDWLLAMQAVNARDDQHWNFMIETGKVAHLYQ